MAVIKDVAKLAGVSTGTVSKYLNNPAGLKAETKLKVEKAIRELEYKPSPLARSMRTGKTNTVAVVVPDIINPFFAEIYNSIRISAIQSGYTPILYTTEDDLNTLKDYLSDMLKRNADGAVLCFLDEDEAVEKFIDEVQEYIPVVLISWDMSNTSFNSVVVDVFEGIYKSTKHLLELGHESIAYIGGPAASHISKEKYNGYAKALKDAGCIISPELVYHGKSYSLQTGYQAARRFSMLDTSPTAVVGANDILAIGSIKYFLQRRIRVPDDIAVVGFDNISLSSMYEPSLSTVSLPINQMGSEAIKLALSKIRNPLAKNRQIILKTSLIIRNSTDKNIPLEFGL